MLFRSGKTSALYTGCGMFCVRSKGLIAGHWGAWDMIPVSGVVGRFSRKRFIQCRETGKAYDTH